LGTPRGGISQDHAGKIGRFPRHSGATRSAHRLGPAKVVAHYGFEGQGHGGCALVARPAAGYTTGHGGAHTTRSKARTSPWLRPCAWILLGFGGKAHRPLFDRRAGGGDFANFIGVCFVCRRALAIDEQALPPEVRPLDGPFGQVLSRGLRKLQKRSQCSGVHREYIAFVHPLAFFPSTGRKWRGWLILARTSSLTRIQVLLFGL